MLYSLVSNIMSLSACCLDVRKEFAGRFLTLTVWYNALTIFNYNNWFSGQNLLLIYPTYFYICIHSWRVFDH